MTRYIAKKPPRKRTHPDIETAILAKSARRCALCFHLSGDLTEKHGQIAHLDGDRTNDAEDNLAWMCLTHHSLFDSKTSQHKNYTISEVKDARARLYALVAEEKKQLTEAQKQSLLLKDDALKSELKDKDLRIEEARRKAGQRLLDIPRFLTALRDRPKGTAEIWYNPGDTEAYLFAGQIKRWLGPGVDGDGAGWEVLPVRPIPPRRIDAAVPLDAPADIRHGAGIGLTLRGKLTRIAAANLKGSCG
jgi:hypothetical protein